ncbi:MAG TPA: MDR family oxidoreductase [Burkholderiaceae bacterium]|nr:MDR family oxidoreductase [Burkholderiaceae bacterium]
MSFRALYLTRENEQFHAELRALDETELPRDGDVTLRIEYSTINYKDALALTDRGPVVRRWPMVPGIDGAGIVEASSHPDWRVGDRVVLNGFGVGELHWGCLAEKARVRGDWLIAMPPTLDGKWAMSIGTAGYTAMLSCMAIDEHGVKPGDGEVLVTGATGGVGSIAVALLAARGYRVVASTGKAAQTSYLRSLGAADVIDRASLAQPGKPLQKERWAAVVDCVGSHTLANACAQTRYAGVVTACGLAQGMDFPGSVAPFILRGIRLIGIDSVNCPIERRRKAWARLSRELHPDTLAGMTREIGLSECLNAAQQLLASQVRGRLLVRIDV